MGGRAETVFSCSRSSRCSALALVSGLARAANTPTSSQAAPRALHREQPDVDERPARVRRGDREGVQAEDRVPHDRAERRDPSGQLEQRQRARVAARRRLGRGRAAAGAVRPPREPREPLLLRKGLRRRGARVGGPAVPAHGVAAARVRRGRGDRRVFGGRRRGRHGPAAGRRRVGGGAATGAGPAALPVGRHPSRHGSGRTSPRWSSTRGCAASPPSRRTPSSSTGTRSGFPATPRACSGTPPGKRCPCASRRPPARSSSARPGYPRGRGET